MQTLHDRLRTQMQKENLPQRILFSGGGSDALRLAIDLAATMQECPSERIEKDLHTDIVLFRDTGKSFKIDYSDAAKRDGQSEYENVRGLIQWAHRKPSEGRWRIVILENIERISRDAPHALLKLIEEPPAHAVFFFTTRNHHQMLDTILSRMTVVRLPASETMTHIDPLSEAFLERKDLIERFRMIEELDQSIKDDGDKSTLWAFIEGIIALMRDRSEYLPFLELAWETYDRLKANQNRRFCLEYMALTLCRHHK